MPYDIVCDECDFHKVEHRMDAAESRVESHEEETGHSTEIREFRMNA